MKKIKVDHLTIGEDTFPIYCDLIVLEQIQERYESISAFERELLGQEITYDEDGNALRDDKGTIVKKYKEPSIKAVRTGLYLMIKEGQRIEAKQGIETEEIEEEDLSAICTMSYTELALIVHGLFMKCFVTKKNEEKKTSRKMSR